MNQDQEIKAKALEIAVMIFSAMNKDGKTNEPNKDGEYLIINIAKVFEVYIKG